MLRRPLFVLDGSESDEADVSSPLPFTASFAVRALPVPPLLARPLAVPSVERPLDAESLGFFLAVVPPDWF